MHRCKHHTIDYVQMDLSLSLSLRITPRPRMTCDVIGRQRLIDKQTLNSVT